jgi:hypothetical protein
MTVIDLRNRSTTSKKTPEIDSLYVYATRHKVKFTHRHQLGVGYKYTNHKAILTAGEDEIHIYHRTAEIRGVTQGITLVTKNGKFREVQRWFNEQIKAISADDALFEKFSHAKATPRELGIYYLH